MIISVSWIGGLAQGPFDKMDVTIAVTAMSTELMPIW
jgi:hypothetical protein